MSTPSVLVMDLGGVMCRWVPDRRLAALSLLSGLPEQMVETQVFDSGFDDAGERGHFSLGAFTEQLAAILGLPISPDTDAALRTAWCTAFEPNAAVIDLVGSATCRTALFTNNGPLLELGLQAELSAVGDVFDALLFSWHLGATKPDPASFERAASALGVEPGHVLFVDDSVDNVAAATAAGWHAHRFTTALDLQAALAGAGLR